jgi:protease I
MNNNVTGKRVAILVENGFEQSELQEPRKALEQAGVKTDVVSPQREEVRGWNEQNWGERVRVDVPLEQANPNDYDGLLLPGGVMNPDKLRMNASAVRFVQAFFGAGKPLFSICHGPWMLVEANAVRGRTVTSWPSLKTDIRNAGGNWVDQEVVTDNGIVTSRKPADIPAFNRKMLEELAEGRHDRREETVPLGIDQTERDLMPAG